MCVLPWNTSYIFNLHHCTGLDSVFSQGYPEKQNTYIHTHTVHTVQKKDRLRFKESTHAIMEVVKSISRACWQDVESGKASVVVYV